MLIHVACLPQHYNWKLMSTGGLQPETDLKGIRKGMMGRIMLANRRDMAAYRYVWHLCERKLSIDVLTCGNE